MLGTTVTVGVEHIRLESDEFKKYLNTQTILIFIITLILTLICIIFGNLFLPYKSITYEWFIFIPIATLLAGVYDNFMIILRNKDKAILYGVVGIMKTIIEVFLTILILFFFLSGWQGRILSLFIISVLGLFISIYYSKKWGYWGIEFHKKYAQNILKTSVAIIPERLSIIVLSSVNRFFIDSEETLGLFSAAGQYANILIIMITAFLNAFTPYIYSKLKENTHRGNILINKVTYTILLIIFLIFGSMLIASPLYFNYYIDGAFTPAQIYITPLLLGYFFNCVLAIFKIFLLYERKNKQIMVISYISAALCILLHYLFKVFLGDQSIVYATCLSYFISALLTIFAAFSTKKIGFPYFLQSSHK